MPQVRAIYSSQCARDYELWWRWGFREQSCQNHTWYLWAAPGCQLRISLCKVLTLGVMSHFWSLSCVSCLFVYWRNSAIFKGNNKEMILGNDKDMASPIVIWDGDGRRVSEAQRIVNATLWPSGMPRGFNTSKEANVLEWRRWGESNGREVKWELLEPVYHLRTFGFYFE